MYRTPAFRSASFLTGISRGSRSLVVAVALLLNGRNRIATAGDYEEIDALAVDRAVGPRIGEERTSPKLTCAITRHLRSTVLIALSAAYKT